MASLMWPTYRMRGSSLSGSHSFFSFSPFFSFSFFLPRLFDTFFFFFWAFIIFCSFLSWSFSFSFSTRPFPALLRINNNFFFFGSFPHFLLWLFHRAHYIPRRVTFGCCWSGTSSHHRQIIGFSAQPSSKRAPSWCACRPGLIISTPVCGVGWGRSFFSFYSNSSFLLSIYITLSPSTRKRKTTTIVLFLSLLFLYLRLQLYHFLPWDLEVGCYSSWALQSTLLLLLIV